MHAVRNLALIASTVLASYSTTKADHHLAEPPKAEFPAVPNDIPFALRLTGNRPSSLDDIVDQIYDALPEDHLHRIAAYFGGVDYDAYKGYYPDLDAFYRDLRITPIMQRAEMTWGIQENDALYRRIECVGPDFSYQVALQIALRYMRSAVGQEDASASERGRGFRQASYISHRLFEVCDERG